MTPAIVLVIPAVYEAISASPVRVIGPLRRAPQSLIAPKVLPL